MSRLIIDLVFEQLYADPLNELNAHVRNVMCLGHHVGVCDLYESVARSVCTLRAVCRRYYERTSAGVDAYLAYRQLLRLPARPLLDGGACLALENPIGGLNRRALIELTREFERRMPLWHTTPLRQATVLEGGIALPHSLELAAFQHVCNCSREYLISPPVRRILDLHTVELGVTASIRPTNLKRLENVDVWDEADVDESSELRNPCAHVHTTTGWTSPSLISFRCRYGVPLHVFGTFVEALREQGFIVVEFCGVLEKVLGGQCKLELMSRYRHLGQIVVTQRSLVKDFGFVRQRELDGFVAMTNLYSPRTIVNKCEIVVRRARARYRKVSESEKRGFFLTTLARELQRAEDALLDARTKLFKCQRELNTYRQPWRRSSSGVHSSTP